MLLDMKKADTETTWLTLSAATERALSRTHHDPGKDHRDEKPERQKNHHDAANNPAAIGIGHVKRIRAQRLRR
jgi:carboxypeptidase C (cathepsin A)